MSWLRCLRAGCQSFRRDESGSVLLYVTIFIITLVALVALAVDGARLMFLNGNLQEIADAAALAGADELDGRADAITRARDAAISSLNNHPEWSDISVGGSDIASDGVNGPVFYSSLDPDVQTTNPKYASFIRVTTVRRELNLTFGRVLTSRDTAGTKATATARSAFASCAAIQSFLCNPWEAEQDSASVGGATNWAGKVQAGQMFKLLGGTGGAPGNWGLIDPPGGKGHSPHNQPSFWAELQTDNCSLKTANEVTNYVDPGNNASAAKSGVNVRFDNPVNGLDNTAAPIVIDGLKNQANGGYGCKNDISATGGTTSGGLSFAQTDSNWQAYDAYCNTVSPTQLGSCPLPRDRDLVAVNGANPDLTQRGSGANGTDLDAYWHNHHTGTRPIQLDTRYKIYLCEADPDNAEKCFGASGDFTQKSETKEASTPQCNESSLGNTTRRLIRVAIVDCGYWDVTGASRPLPIVTTAAEFFLTEPAETSSTPSLDGRIYGELVRTFTVNGQDSGLYHIVQLVK